MVSESSTHVPQNLKPLDTNTKYVQFALSHFPENPAPEGAIVSIKAGLAANLTEPGGGIKAVSSVFAS